MKLIPRKPRRNRRNQQQHPGRTRIKLAKVLNDYFETDIQPEDIWQNSAPCYRLLDCARWGVSARLPSGQTVNIHSFSRMGDVLKEGIQTPNIEPGSIEV